MKFKQKQEQEFPVLTKKKVEDDGFGHMVEEETETEELEATKDLNQTGGGAGNVLKINPIDFDYDQSTDTVKPKNEKAFDNLVEQHPTVHTLERGDNRDKKIAGLKLKS